MAHKHSLGILVLMNNDCSPPKKSNLVQSIVGHEKLMVLHTQLGSITPFMFLATDSKELVQPFL